MIKILILEDELLLAEDLKAKLENLNYKVVGIATSGEEVIAMINRNQPDLLILDIHVDGDMDGLEAGSYIRKTFDLPIIYLTQYKDLQTFERAKMVNPSSYLTKPVNILDLVRAIELGIASTSLAKMRQADGYALPKAFFLKSGEQSFEKVALNEILYLKASGAYTEIYTESKKFLFSDNLSFFERKLIAPELVRVHRSWVINIEKVERIEEMLLVIADEKIPIGKTYKSTVKQLFTMI